MHLARNRNFRIAKTRCDCPCNDKCSRSATVCGTGAVSITVEQTLEKYSDWFWIWDDVDGAHWTETDNRNNITVVNTKGSLSNGTYRLKSVFTLTNSSGKTETITIYSVEKRSDDYSCFKTERMRHMFKSKIAKRIVSFVVAAAIAVSTSMTSVLADSKIAEDSLVDVISEKDIPECLALEVSERDKFAARLYAKETSLDTVLFANKDGSETIYIFNEDVKYIDENGKVADKSNKLYADVKSRSLSAEYSYVNKDNDIKTYFPKSLKTDVGVVVEALGKTIELYPLSNTVSKVIPDEDMLGVYYDDVFGEFTGVRYEPSFSGYKEDIILENNVTNKFGFILETGDLVAVLENGIIYIRDNNGEDFGIISPTYVYDSFVGEVTSEDERHFTLNNELVLNPVSEGKYELVIIVDEEFLNNPKTVYPVIVDPSVTINATGSGSSKSILDTPIYNGSGASGVSAGANSTAIIGYVNSSYGSGRLLMSFPGLMSQAFMNTTYYNINSATLTIKEVSGQSSSASIAVHKYVGPSWDESTTYNSSIWNGDGILIDSCSYSYPNSTLGSYDILSAVRSWQANPSSASLGLILKNKTSETASISYKSFYTSEGSTKPYLTVTYVGINTNFENAHMVSVGEDIYVNVQSSREKRYFQFIAPSTGYYSFESRNTGVDPYGWLYDSKKDSLDESDDHGGNRNFHIIRKLTAGQMYYFAAGLYGTGTGSYFMSIVFREKPDDSVYKLKGGLEERTVSIQLSNSTAADSSWKPLIEAAKNGWNSSKAGTNISLTTSSSSFRLYVDYYPWDEIGRTYTYPEGADFSTSGTIQINRSTIDDSDNVRISVIAHEMGHLFWLADNPSIKETSLMSYHRSYETVIRPQFIDVYHVVQKYESMER